MLIAASVLIFIECLGCFITYALITKLPRKSKKSLPELPADIKTRRELLSNDETGAFFKHVKQSAKANIDFTERNSITLFFEEAGFVSSFEQKRLFFAALSSSVLGFSLSVLFWKGSAESKLLAGALVFAGITLLWYVVLYVVRVRLQRAYAFWLSVTVELLISGFLSLQSTIGAIQITLKNAEVRKIRNPFLNDLHNVLVLSQLHGDHLKGLKEAIKLCPNKEARSVLRTISRHESHGVEVIRPIIDAANALESTSDFWSNTQASEAKSLLYVVQAFRAQLSLGKDPLFALEAACGYAESHSKVEGLLVELIDALRAQVPNVWERFPTVPSLPEFEMFVQVLMLGLEAPGRLSNTLERIEKYLLKRMIA